VSTNELRVSNDYLTKTKWHTEMKLTPLEGQLQNIFAACGRSDVTPTMATKSATVDMAVKWRLNPRRRIEFVHGGFLWNFLRKSR
jgi:hypothetical protein